ncbi:MAG: glycosyltransferase family 2 protein [Candidatus Omnitrophica bacterium]|nr:glycosyltransferase family 2 protein [Candidatus Omnitrophota bacterium]
MDSKIEKKDMVQTKLADLTFIMCAYNEIGRIEKAYEDLLVSLKNRTEQVEILFFDNGSTDGTREWLKAINHPDVQVFFNETNLGKGGSVKRGIGFSRGNYIVIYDPDCEYRAEDVWKCYDHAKETEAAFVLGSRALNGDVKYHYYLNYLGVMFLTFLTNLLYGCKLTDTASATKLFDGNFLRQIILENSGFDLDFELVTRVARLGGKISEVAINYYSRTVEEGKKIRPFQDGFLALKTIIRDRFVTRESIVAKEQIDQDKDHGI